ncbi:MAG: AraC family transcriptional regulator [Ruminococcaceae bacterium]|nr:AraC family transcriptional regulator [Oscillospiraceae bacterium]
MKKVENKFPFSMYTANGEGRIINAHTNESSMEIIEILRGEVHIQIGIESVEASAGDFIYIPPTLVFRADAISENASLRGMVFDASILEANMENFDAEVFYMFHLQSRNKANHFVVGHPVYNILAKYMQESYDEYAAKDVCYKLPIRANIYLMMTALLRYYCGSKDESDRMIYHNVLRLRPVMEYIAEHYCEKIYIEKLSEMITVSPDYFTKMFKDSIGKTPIEYINGLRVNEAMRRLAENEDSMAEIADAIGFCNPNYFHKIFKQYMDTSPLAYRKSTR